MRFSLLFAHACASLLFATSAIASQATRTPLHRVAGRVWLDRDQDGRRGVHEPGVAQVRVNLLDAYGRALDGVTTLTREDGRYAFEGLPAGEYRVGFERPAGRRFTKSDVGAQASSGVRITADTHADDSDVNLVNGYLDPTRRGPWETGMRSFELTRLSAAGEPWPINGWVVYPAQSGSSTAPKARVRDLYLDDAADLANTLAATKLGAQVTATGPAFVTPADPDSVLQDIEARVDAPVASGGPYPVALVFSGLLGGVADVVEIADQLASHGYVSLCLETTAFHSSVRLGHRLQAQGGPWMQSDFDHVPQLGGGLLQSLHGFGYQASGFLTCSFTTSASTQASIVAADASFALDAAEQWNGQAGHFLHGLLEVERVPWIGFSRGASTAPLGASTDPRVGLVVNIDSSTFVNVSKPMLWVGNHVLLPTGGPSIQARLTGDFHPHYIFVPATRFDPPSAAARFHREFHHDFRNHLLTAFCGLYSKNAQAYRADLGLDGQAPEFDGYVTPFLRANFPGWHTAPFTLENGAGQELDAGLVGVRLWMADEDRLYSLSTSSLEAGPVGSAELSDHGRILVATGAALAPLSAPVRGLAIDSRGVAWFAAGSPAVLHELDTRAVAQGGPAVARRLGPVLGLPDPVGALAFEPRSARLFALAGPGARRLFAFSPEEAAGAVDLGPLPVSVGEPRGLDFDARGRLWITDSSGQALVRVTAAGGQDLDVLDMAGVRAGAVAYDGTGERLFVHDRVTGELASVDSATGSLTSHGSLGALGLGRRTVLSFERVEPTAGLPFATAASAPPPASAEPRPVLQALTLAGPASGSAGAWDGFLLRAQVAEGSGNPLHDGLTLATGGTLALGQRAEVDLPALRIGEAQEVLWNGLVVAWLETDWDLALGGSQLAPVRVAFTDLATTSAVEAVMRALHHTGPLPRRITLELLDPMGTRGNPTTVELE